jgi:dTDP-4-amino-4,6-dideoxygalactose transaminase
MNQITKIAKKHKLLIVEDACQAHGASIQSKKTGSWGDIGCFSFYPTKNMTTGEGGMITTSNKKIAEKIRLLRNHGMQERYSYDSFGFNYRMTEISAAIGIEQLKKLSGFNKIRISNAQTLIAGLSHCKEILLPYVPAEYTHVFHQFTIKISRTSPIARQEFIKKMKEKKITTGIYYPNPVHKTKVYANFNYKLPVAERVAQEVVSLPVNPSLKQEDLKRIIKAIISICS